MTTYATPTLQPSGRGRFKVAATWQPDGFALLGEVHDKGPVGWTASTATGLPVGLFPHRQAAAEALLKHAGYELAL
ncbi:hypothetical protein HPO96_37230 [Kribbella sandramycini]|uniref:Uncharacterized protein n=1 Tax=Kribbella sandramycini TaxID=60450 RepID=A0A7Y4P537_9ACTN|nr:hypothetical protein [Kribbella sandramycini]MBB6564448.1 hypothetical protein [Kribbella sandramycini]NOL45904.1 hypothetical protein [Kribbella sandramycini]